MGRIRTRSIPSRSFTLKTVFSVPSCSVFRDIYFSRHRNVTHPRSLPNSFPAIFYHARYSNFARLYR